MRRGRESEDIGIVRSSEDEASEKNKKAISNKAWYAVAFAATISSLTAATLGYDVGIMAAAIDFISDTMNLNHGQTQV